MENMIPQSQVQTWTPLIPFGLMKISLSMMSYQLTLLMKNIFLKCIWKAPYVHEHLLLKKKKKDDELGKESPQKKAHKCKPQLDILQVVPLKELKTNVSKKPFKWCLQRKKCQKKVSNYISPFIFIINPQFLDFVPKYGNFYG
jgi:hypothetical protein